MTSNLFSYNCIISLRDQIKLSTKQQTCNWARIQTLINNKLFGCGYNISFQCQGYINVFLPTHGTYSNITCTYSQCSPFTAGLSSSSGGMRLSSWIIISLQNTSLYFAVVLGRASIRVQYSAVWFYTQEGHVACLSVTKCDSIWQNESRVCT